MVKRGNFEDRRTALIHPAGSSALLPESAATPGWVANDIAYFVSLSLVSDLELMSDMLWPA